MDIALANEQIPLTHRPQTERHFTAKQDTHTITLFQRRRAENVITFLCRGKDSTCGSRGGPSIPIFTHSSFDELGSGALA